MAIDSTTEALPDLSHAPPSPDDPGAPGAGEGTGRSRRRLRIAALAVAVLLIAGAAIWWFAVRGGDDATTDTTGGGVTMVDEVVEVTRGDMAQTVSAEGTVAAAATDELSFGSAGTVTAVNVAAGDTVTAGQVLATIDSAELEAAVASAQADLAEAEAKLADDTDAAASDEQLEADEASVTSAEDQLVNAVEDLAGASLVATIDGTVTQVDLTVGEQLNSDGSGGTSQTGSDSGSGRTSANLGSSGGGGPGGNDDATGSSAQVTVVSTGRYTVELAVDSSDIDDVAVGQQVALTVSSSSSSQSGPGGGAFPGGFAPPSMTGPRGADDSDDEDQRPTTRSDAATATGTVTQVGRVADASSGVASYPVTVTFEADASEFYVGTTVVAEITTESRTDVLQVTSRAVTTSGGTSQVTVAVDGTADGETETRTVTTGETIGGVTEIVSGLEEGEKVLVQVPSFGGSGPPGGQMPSGSFGGSGPPGGQMPGGGGQVPAGVPMPGGGDGGGS